MKARMHRFILHNDQIHEASEKLLSPGQIGLLSGWGVFSTIKVIDGVLFAFQRHWARMSRDAALMRVALPKVMAPEKELLPLMFRNAPSLATPVPFRVNASAPTGPAYANNGDMLPPANYREWIYLTSGIDMSYSPKATSMGEDRKSVV